MVLEGEGCACHGLGGLDSWKSALDLTWMMPDTVSGPGPVFTALPVLGPYILASPRDALKNLCYSYCPETAQVAKSPCDRNDEAQNFMYDAEANTLLHNDQCLGVERHSNRGFKGLALMECPQSREEGAHHSGNKSHKNERSPQK